MSLQNFVYISKTKLDIYLPQIPDDFNPDKVKFGIEIDLKPVKIKADTEKSIESDSDIFKLRRVVSFLNAHNEIGKIGSDKEFIYGTVYAHARMVGHKVFFFGSVETNGKRIIIGLSCSINNMIGGGYLGADFKSDKQYRGKAKAEILSTGSGNAGFATDLAEIGVSKSYIEKIVQNHDVTRREWLAEFRVTESDLQSINKKAFFNRFIFWANSNPTEPKFDLGISLPKFPPSKPKPPLHNRRLSGTLSWILGENLYRDKIKALNKREMYKIAEEKMRYHPQSRGILEKIVFNESRSTGNAQSYRVVALKLLEDTINNDRVVLASPLYMILEPFS